MHVVIAFVVHEAIAVILAGEALDFSILMLKRSAVDAVRDAGVKSAGVART
jgi:hypothetical protein